MGPLVLHACRIGYGNQRLHPFLILSRQRLRRPCARHSVHPVTGCVLLLSVHPSRHCIYHPNACLDSGLPWGGGNTTNTPITKNLLRGGEPPKSRRNLLTLSRGRRLRGKNTPQSLQPRYRCGGEHLFAWEHQSPQQKCFHFLQETFLHTLPSYGHVYSFSSEGCTRCKGSCTVNHGFPRLPPVPNAKLCQKVTQKRWREAICLNRILIGS